jgi:hypothetical protein
LCIDTKSGQRDLRGYRPEGAAASFIMDGDEINTRFHALVSVAPAERIIIDNGASSFVPLPLPHQQSYYRRCCMKWSRFRGTPFTGVKPLGHRQRFAQRAAVPGGMSLRGLATTPIGSRLNMRQGL